MKKATPKTDFSSLTLSTLIFSAIKKVGYEKPTDVQLEVIPAVLDGRDVLARAETGSGKTAAFVLPLLENIIRHRKPVKHGNINRTNNIDIVVLVPTRELAIQIREEFERFSTEIEPRVKCLSVYGGVKINPQMIALRGGADVLVSTPGRLLDLERNNAIRLHQVKTLVVDEVDRLMKGDFQEEIEEIFKLMPKKRQNLMFTATFPETIRKLVRQIMNEPAVINVDDLYDDVDINQRVITVNRDKKNDLLAHLLKENDWKHVLIFCSAKRTCDNLVKKLEKRGVEAVAMHGNLQQNARARALREFKEGKTRILIATDVAGRGIDIEQLPCVINYELPRSPNDYTHRIGRTGRAGEQGTAISLISHQEYQHFGVIEKRNGIRLKREQIAGFEADAKAPEVPQRTQSKKKAKSKKRQSLVDKKVETRKNKLATESQIAKKEALAKKEKFAEKARAERKQSAATKPLAGKKPSGHKESFYGKKPKTQEKASAETKAKSFYKEKPFVDDKQGDKPSGKTTSERVFFGEDKEQDHKENKTADKPQPAGKSLYTRKLPKEED